METRRDVNPAIYWTPLHYQILFEMAMVVQVSYKYVRKQKKKENKKPKERQGTT